MLSRLDENDSSAAERIRQLNDTLRRTGSGGRIVVTAGVAALGPEKIAAIIQAVATFSAFGCDNDPNGEHDCALLTAAGHRRIWKIDYYDPSLAAQSEDPARESARGTRHLSRVKPVPNPWLERARHDWSCGLVRVYPHDEPRRD